MNKPEIKEPEQTLQQIIATREVTMQKAREFQKQLTAELKYKQDQLKNEIIEKNISQLYDLRSFPLDDKKPKHVIEIEIDILKSDKKKFEDNLKVMEELQVEDKKKESENATKTV